jgi:hypothetical protein
VNYGCFPALRKELVMNRSRPLDPLHGLPMEILATHQGMTARVYESRVASVQVTHYVHNSSMTSTTADIESAGCSRPVRSQSARGQRWTPPRASGREPSVQVMRQARMRTARSATSTDQKVDRRAAHAAAPAGDPDVRERLIGRRPGSTAGLRSRCRRRGRRPRRNPLGSGPSDAAPPWRREPGRAVRAGRPTPGRAHRAWP